MIEIRDKETGQSLGQFTDEDLQFLIDELEEESLTDHDYYIDEPTIEMLEEDGAPAGLITFLRKALGDREGMEIAWIRT